METLRHDTPTFRLVRRGYDPIEVDRHLAVLRQRIEELHDPPRADSRQLPHRLAEILDLAGQEADDIRARASDEARDLVLRAQADADAIRERAARSREDAESRLTELAATRTYMLDRLVELRGQIIAAIEYHESDAHSSADVTAIGLDRTEALEPTVQPAGEPLDATRAFDSDEGAATDEA